MKRATGEAIIKAFAVLSWVEAALLVLFALGLFFAGPTLDFLISADAPLVGNAIEGVGITAGVILLLFAALYAATGTGLWKHYSWGRTLALLLAVVSLFAFPFGTIIGLMAIWFLGFNDIVKGLFYPARS